MSEEDEAYSATLVRRHDPARFLLAMLYPERHRSDLLNLYAFNTEIARIRESVSEALLGEIRLQWWRDAIEGLYAGRSLEHGVVRPLGETIERHGLTRAYFDRLIDGRARDLDDRPPETMEELEGYARETAAPLILLALEVLGVNSPPANAAATHAGIAWALSGLIRATPYALRSGWRYFPTEPSERHGFTSRDMTGSDDRDALLALVRELAECVDRQIAEARHYRGETPRAAIPALLPVSYAALCQRQLRNAGFDPYDIRVVSPPPFVAWRLLLTATLGRY